MIEPGTIDETDPHLAQPAKIADAEAVRLVQEGSGTDAAGARPPAPKG